VDSVLVVNPGTLARRRAAGTYARLTVHAMSVEGEAVLAHRAYERTRVDIVRI
jgi:DNA polymerase alpha subunit B